MTDAEAVIVPVFLFHGSKFGNVLILYETTSSSPIEFRCFIMHFLINPETLQTLVTKGRSLDENLKQAVTRRGHEYVAPKEIAPNYDTMLDSGRVPGLEAHRGLIRFLDGEGCPTKNHVFVEIFNPGGGGAPPYQNFVHASGTDLLYTQNLIQDIAKRRRLLVGQTTELDNRSDDFLALLATDNGKGVARMLATYPRLFGRKVIARARVFVLHAPAILWMLEEVEVPEANPLPQKTNPSRKERRHLRKASRASTCSLG
ncbi:hypothetical protein FZEAL_10609 [Fusarium zealandicum]|uniref:Uncharacterized protein n=1 Tax=Fusarium zealandicum TaxID=1053134 RepID=A0A8H4TZ98_9HYPO|nr:hypothetical protein FZEAL_10609 [Fusarium zealandicum]